MLKTAHIRLMDSNGPSPWRSRLVVLRSHLSPSPVNAEGELPPQDLFGGPGFFDAVGIKQRKQQAGAGNPVTRRQQLIKTLDAMGLSQNVRELDEEGWTTIKGAMTPELTGRLRKRIMELTHDQLTKPRRSGLRFAQLGSLLYHGREFEEACQCPKQMALAEYMVGASNGVWQYLCSVRGEGTSGLPVHNDLGPGWREPFNIVPDMVTSLFICDEFHKDAGCTFVVPKSHFKCRRPRIESAEDREYIQREARPVVADPGDIVMWTANLWHGALPRRIPGERVVCSYVNTRVHIRLGDDYSQLPDEVLARNPPRFAQMIGRSGTGYGEQGVYGGVLFGGAKNAAQTSKFSIEEEETPDADPVRRFVLAREASTVA